MSKQLRILYPDQIWPEKITGGYLRTFNLAKLAYKEFQTNIFGISENKEYEHEVDEIRLIQEKKYDNLIGKLKHYSEGIFSKNYSLMNSKKAFINLDLEETIFQIERPIVYNLLEKHNIKNYILDEHNVYWEFSEFPTFDFKNKIYNKMNSKRDKKIEIKAIKNAANILVCSERDSKLILQEIPEAEGKITIIPNCVDMDEYSSYMHKTSIKDNFKVLFVGLLSYEPNLDAVNSICDIIAPNCDNVEFIIAGNNPPYIKDKPKNVKFLGFVEDLKKCISESDICIAPLRYGSGTRFKILEYMAMKKPVISTSKGAEGIDYTKNENIIIEDDITKFGSIIYELLQDEKRMNQVGKKARKLIKSKYDWQIYEKSLNDIYNEVLDAN